jgi:hypothetical protein
MFFTQAIKGDGYSAIPPQGQNRQSVSYLSTLCLLSSFRSALLFAAFCLINSKFADVVSSIGKTVNLYIKFNNIFKTKLGSLFRQVLASMQNVFP